MIKRFNNLRISSKLLAGFVLVALIAGMIGITGISYINTLNQSGKDLYEKMTVPIVQMSSISTAFQRSRVNVRDMIIAENEEDIQYYIDRINERRAEVTQLCEEFEKLIISPEMSAAYADFLEKRKAYGAQLDIVIGLAKENRDAEALVLIQEEGTFGKASRAEQDAIIKIVEMKTADALAKSSENSVQASGIMQAMGILLAAAILISVFLGWFIAKIISKPLKQALQMIQEMSIGHLGMRLKMTSKDEIGLMAAAMDSFADDIQNVVIGTIRKISEGDVSTIIIPRDEKDEIAPTLKKTMDAINALITDANMLSKAAVEGKLSTRADALRHQGDFAKIVQGVNNTLDAVIQPVQEATAVLKEMSNGNLSLRVNGNYQGDHAVIKNAMNETLDSLSTYVEEISSVLTEMANSNMIVELSGDYKGDFAQIKEALNLIIQSFDQTLTDINHAADQVAAGARQVSDGGQALSQGAIEQASSIEELTTSITQIAAQTKQNATSANEANKLAMTAKNNASNGNTQMREMLKAMEEINVSSANISKIIKVIDEIAFQTNILALNAAVEAARAGQHGKGFAVVAEEVRNLAARSASAAKETTGLIEGSIKKVDTGTKIANETAEALEKIVDDVSKAANLVGTIAIASNEQAAGIAQINLGVEQVSVVVQSNSSTAQESAAASEELSGQAEMLKEMIGQFNLRGTENGNGSNPYRDPAEKRIPPVTANNHTATRNSKNLMVKKTQKNSLSDVEFGKY